MMKRVQRYARHFSDNSRATNRKAVNDAKSKALF